MSRTSLTWQRFFYNTLQNRTKRTGILSTRTSLDHEPIIEDKGVDDDRKVVGGMGPLAAARLKLYTANDPIRT